MCPGRASTPPVNTTSYHVELVSIAGYDREFVAASLESVRRDEVPATYRSFVDQLDEDQGDPLAATRTINQWAADKTRDKIRDLIPDGSIDVKRGSSYPAYRSMSSSAETIAKPASSPIVIAFDT